MMLSSVEIILRRTKNSKRYDFVDNPDSSLTILAVSLIEETDLMTMPLLRKWLLDESNVGPSCGDMTCIAKKGSDIILFYEWANYDNPDLRIPLKTFLDVLNQWEQLLHEMPDEIDIMQEGPRIVLKGRNA